MAREHEFAGTNNRIADKLRRAADILAAQGADMFRIAAYRRAAQWVRGLDNDLGTIAALNRKADMLTATTARSF